MKWRDLLGRASDAVWNSSWLLPALFVIFLPVLIVAALVFLALSPLFEEDRRDRD